MGFTKKTVTDISVTDKTVLVRVDYNVPLDEKGRITDDYRIKKSLPTIKYLREQGARIVLCTHLGRPDGEPVAKYSLKPCAERLSELLNISVQFATDCVGEDVASQVGALKPKQVLLLENLRFHVGEKENDPAFGAQLAQLADIFVQDGFGIVHRAHASTVAVTKHIPSVAGLLVAEEVRTITGVMEQPNRPLMAIIGGRKISDKITILSRFIEIADFVAVGGAMANTFLLASGVDIGKSVAESSEVPLAKKIIARAQKKAAAQQFIFYIPQDGVVATRLHKTAETRIVDWEAHVIASIQHYPKRPPRRTGMVLKDEMILDVGPFSSAFIAGGMQMVQTVIWNGAMGVTETDGLQGPVGPFAHGTELIVDAMLGEFGHKPYSVLGGGDTVGYVEERQLTGLFGHVSTGGGASIQLMSGEPLPGVEALLNA